MLELRGVAGRARARRLAALHGFAPLVAIQPMYNLVKRTAEIEILPMAQSLGIAVIPYSPTGGGLLTGKYGVDRAPERGRLLDTKMYTVRYAQPRDLRDRRAVHRARRGARPRTRDARGRVGRIASGV